ncbi:MAG TPA: hypothetical protein H9754_04665 [Candidatus Anaerostipes avistercoris]|uniref:Uncharacterized protein n=1 Tax=Candidatus Anaerostipes avistercoris TaxID=2838462 RepID=A0A9D2PFR3_9FIRM|nr:hypothetical protein [uncultured Anaerostipes sp.]HJC49862.1 hypothetical protein [Candidatus Anaerostipes avistercoris]
MKISKNLKKIIIALIIVGVCVVLFYPFTFERYIRNKQKVQIAVMDSMSQTSGDKGNTVTYEAGTEEFQKIREILADYQYHHTIKSFINNPQLSGDPDEFIMLVMENDSLILTNGGEILINGRLYRIGYGDGARAQKMIDEIKAVME